MILHSKGGGFKRNTSDLFFHLVSKGPEFIVIVHIKFYPTSIISSNQISLSKNYVLHGFDLELSYTEVSLEKYKYFGMK